MTEGEILKKLVQEKGLTTESFAAKMGLRRQAVSIMYGKAKLTTAHKKKAAQILGVSEKVFDVEAKDERTITIQERDALWQIIEAQKQLIQKLQELK